jgi:uncharacterized protein
VGSPLVLNVVELLRRPGSTRRVDLHPSAAELSLDDARVADDESVAVDLAVESANGGLVVHGTAITRVVVACARCLEPVHLEVTGEVDEVFQRVPEHPDAVALVGEQLDLRSVVREGILLAIPVAPLCRPDCPGLCPICGAELSTGPCGCVVETRDPRWDVLDRLRDETSE